MKQVIVLLAGMLLLIPPARADESRVVDIEVTGMTCPFCVYGTEKKLEELPGVKQVDVSLKRRQARVVMEAGQSADLDAIRKAIVEAGFTPGKVTIQPAEAR